MSTASLEPTALQGDLTEVAADAARRFHESLDQPVNGTIMLRTQDGHEVLVPTAAFRLFIDMLTHLASGRGVVVLPEHAELSTQQAADMLNVSRPFLVKLIEDKKLPARKVGTHRRILLTDLLAYRRQQEEEREAVMQELADQAQDLDLGY